MENTINFETLTQAVLFEFEIKGQLSDGAWENARPEGHWRNWCNAEVKVDPENVGRNFWVQKDGYLLSTLVPVIGDRMAFMAKLAIACPDECMAALESGDYDIPEDVNDMKKLERWATESSSREWATKKLLRWIRAGFTVSKLSAAESVNYSEKDLRKDLAAIRRTMKTWR